jgi:hypothetical protein
MRVRVLVSIVLALLLGCMPKLDLGDDSKSSSASSGTDAGTSGADAGFVGGGCGVESNTGAQLCTATTMCPTLVVDVQAMPHCGFRLRGGVPDLVCACGTSLCSMGVFDTCLQAASLLTDQTEASVCAQLSEGRCLEITTTATTPVNDQTTSSSSSSSSSGANPACDTQCVKDCGGGAACASVCNCN